MVKVLFVCMGNICRSPTAHGVFDHVVRQEGLDKRISVDSAGTHAYHVGEKPDPRSSQTASRRGFDLSYIRARKVSVNDFEEFDYVLAMDRENYRNLERMCPPQHLQKVQLFLEFAPHLNEVEVPDPYYGGGQGFERVLDMIEAASEGFIEHLKKRHF
ncbi:MAG: low molecular weight phosphotyrosine protein phosphatase [Gammaproteobacteria bacterium]|nr:low molecular weight phosphotyrosine protein phosphatase [Gammaproteobacteria bacterium]